MNENELRCKGLAAGLTPEHAQQLADAFCKIGLAAAQAAQSFQALFVPYISFTEQLINQCPNKRLVYLALHHPKERVRKKNTRRIFEKELYKQ